MHSLAPDLLNAAHNIYFIITDGVRVANRSSLGPEGVGWREFIMTGDTLGDKVIVRQFAQANSGQLAGDYKAFDT